MTQKPANSSQWEDTPFGTLEEARAAAIKFGLGPTKITASKDGSFRVFQTSIGDQYLIAQQGSGGAVKERLISKAKKSQRREPDRREGPRFKDEDRLLAGPWVDVDHKSFAAIRRYWEENVINFKESCDPEEGRTITINYNGDIYEYYQVWGGSGLRGPIVCRVLRYLPRARAEGIPNAKSAP